MEKRLRKLSHLIKEAHPEAQCAARVDTGPILEHVAAAKAGIGWIGKNTCVIDRKEGSFFFLGEIVTDAPLIPDRPATDHCGTCTRCIDACPTDAIVEPYKLDARACIAYLTIEHKGSIPTQYREAMGTHVFGCDICQDVCPWNRTAPESSLRDFEPREGAEAPELDQLLERLLTDYDGFTRASAMRRAAQKSWIRNVAVAMGNSGQDRFTPLLARLARDPDPIIREHARWAIDRLKSLRSTRILPAP
jgi:epoxyqueuosine reductase